MKISFTLSSLIICFLTIFVKLKILPFFFLFLSYIFSIDLINGLKIYYIDISILNAISQKKYLWQKIQEHPNF